jgi:hypothetical protein
MGKQIHGALAGVLAGLLIWALVDLFIGMYPIQRVAVVTLALLALHNLSSTDRFMCCAFVACVTAMTYQVLNTDAYFDVVDQIGFYGFASLPLVASLSLLWCIQGKLRNTLMSVYGLLVIVNIAFFYVEGLGQDVDQAFLICGLISFAIQCVLMLSTRITNFVHDGVARAYGSIRQHGLARGAAKNDHHVHDFNLLNHRSKSSH